MGHTNTQSIESVAKNPLESLSPNPGVFSNTCSKDSIIKSALRCIQEVGRQKSSLVTKIKATIKPIGTFLWEHFFCRLNNVLKRVGLFSSRETNPSKPLITQEAALCKETKSLSNTNPIVPDRASLLLCAAKINRGS